jgi:predicted kinase
MLLRAMADITRLPLDTGLVRDQMTTYSQRTERDRATLYLMVGLPGSGKTAKAMEIEAEEQALRLSPDEWILSLYGADLDRKRRDSVRETVERLQWQVAERVLALGGNVVLEWGFWSRAERAHFRRRAELLGAAGRLIFPDASPDELWERIAGRDESRSGTLGITKSELDEWVTSFEPPTEDELAWRISDPRRT